MVSKVFPVDDLPERTLEFARRITALPSMTSLMIKESVNQSVDNMGFYTALQACFTYAPAQPLALGRGARQQGPRGSARRRDTQLA